MYILPRICCRYCIPFVFVTLASVGPTPDFTIPVVLTATFSVPPSGGSPTPFECITIPILDDSLLEGDHDFTVMIVNAGQFAPINPAQDTTVVTINDNERKLH